MHQFAEMDQEARAELVAEGLHGEAAATWKISMRYFQQNYEQDVEFAPQEGLAACLTRFHRLHHEFYGYSFPEQAVEIRAPEAFGLRDSPSRGRSPSDGRARVAGRGLDSAVPAGLGTRDGATVSVYRRSQLLKGATSDWARDH